MRWYRQGRERVFLDVALHRADRDVDTPSHPLSHASPYAGFAWRLWRETSLTIASSRGRTTRRR